MKAIYSSLFLLCSVLISVNVYSQNLLPEPQQVSLSDQHYLLDNSWAINFSDNIPENDPAILSLTSELKDRFNLKLKTKTASTKKNNSSHIIRLSVKEGSVQIGEAHDKNKAAIQEQAYRVELNSDEIAITANAPVGLFYGVQTLIQLVKSENGQVFLPEGEIADWPDLELRMIYWDDAHHLERFDAMKRAILQASYYKVNTFALKLEGHFQFKNAKPIVEPYAYTPEEYQELTDYAKAHYVELVPFLDAPAHISFILKHPEYASLRAFPNCNYELSVTNPKADELILGMFDDLMDANKGGKYIFLSTDEAYYTGKSESEKKRAAELGGNGALLAEYITRISNKLHDKGRTVMIWGEFPLKASDVTSLPPHLINAISGNSEEYGTSFKDHGIRHLIFTSAQGSEPIFPNYHKKLWSLDVSHGGTKGVEPLFPSYKKAPEKTLSTGEKQGDFSEGRIGGILNTIRSNIEADRSDFMGIVVCGWADAGLHPETFWLGYATGTAAVWNLSSTDAQDLATRFFNSFYGNKTVQMDRIYHLLSTQAEFWDVSWEWETSKHRTPIFGTYLGVCETPMPTQDQTLPLMPKLSGTDLSLDKEWNKWNKKRLQTAEEYLKENDELMKLLSENLTSVDYQHYNIQVLRSVAELCRQNLNMLLDLQKINELLGRSFIEASSDPSVAVALVDQALDQLEKTRNERNEVLQAVTTVWYQDWYPRVAEANGRKYLDQVDDVKDHRPVRTVDMSYLIYRQLKYPLGKWAEEVVNARNQFAKTNNLPIRTETINWETY